jgi:hypothetical protein
MALLKPGNPSAICTNLRAYISYAEAVEARYKKGPREDPRSGHLVLWERSAIAASSDTAQDLIFPVSGTIEQLLKQFFADFLNARR